MRKGRGRREINEGEQNRGMILDRGRNEEGKGKKGRGKKKKGEKGKNVTR
jgi:hypothetical protein